MAKPKHKQVPALADYQTQKIPRAQLQEDWWSRPPAWRISKLEFVSPFGWHEIHEETVHDIRRKLGHFESMTLNEIFVIQRARNHPVPVSRMCDKAQKRITELKLVIDELYSLRLTGEQRVWCLLNENVLTVLWWDPNHEVCPSHKRHT